MRTGTGRTRPTHPQTGHTASTGGSPDSSQPADGTSGQARADFGRADVGAALGVASPSTTGGIPAAPGGNPSPTGGAPAAGGSVLAGAAAECRHPAGPIGRGRYGLRVRGVSLGTAENRRHPRGMCHVAPTDGDRRPSATSPAQGRYRLLSCPSEDRQGSGGPHVGREAGGRHGDLRTGLGCPDPVSPMDLGAARPSLIHHGCCGHLLAPRRRAHALRAHRRVFSGSDLLILGVD